MCHYPNTLSPLYKNRVARPHIFEVVPAGNHLLELFLQLLTGPDGLLVPGKVRQLLQSRVSEVLRKMLTAPLVGGKEFL
jgi:hypothetical protein